MRRALLVLLALVLMSATGPALARPARAAGTGSITGTVTVPAGYDVRGVQVFVSTTAHPTGFAAGAGSWVGPDGTFALTGLAPGTYHVAFGTFWSDMNPCSYGRDRWWSSPGVAAGSCNGTTLSGAGTVTITDGAATALGTTPLLTDFTPHRYGGRVVAAPGRSVAGVQVELWAASDGAWNLPADWYRLDSVPVRTLGADGAFSFDLPTVPNGLRLTLRFVAPGGSDYVFSFADSGLTGATTGAGGVAFGAGSVGLTALPLAAAADTDLGTRTLKTATTHVSGGVTISGTPEWGRTLTARSDVVWGDAGTGTVLQWLRNGVVVDGLTGPELVLDGLDDGWEVELSVRAVPDGFRAYPGPPIASAPVVVRNTTPFAAGAPRVTGTAATGSVLAASPGLWRPSVATYAHDYRWLRGGTTIAGAIGPTYRVTPADVGARIGVEVTTTRPADSGPGTPWFTGPGVARSVETASVAAGALPAGAVAAWPARKAGARARVGKRVRVSPPALSAEALALGARVGLQWYAGKRLLPGATGRTLKVRRAFRGKVVTVTATVTAPGYLPQTRTIRFGRA
ncbi:carboxypeptidase-like regulatory domain-containing protein [Nocardioides sp. L-11A]|uniref:carboxypeptidase-like regulatory domain-containing protein n=1 Tax=Nocardioides sp. L-11A TaxID=3043848 RepID=UPI00249A32E3|nr:carboxypeptidase-like regulatory domain-containing protein [Nocardioides sp. L-11A]